jgi:hypothetical protein
MSGIVALLYLAILPGAAAGGPTSVSLRALPRVAEAPARVLFTAELSGGEDSEELYCPDLEWTWGDGTRSVQQGSCAPYKAGETAVQREYTTEHEYRKPGRPRVVLVMRKGRRTLGRADVNVIISRKGPSAAVIDRRRPSIDARN